MNEGESMSVAAGKYFNWEKHIVEANMNEGEYMSVAECRPNVGWLLLRKGNELKLLQLQLTIQIGI